jgi:hypothetical protein
MREMTVLLRVRALVSSRYDVMSVSSTGPLAYLRIGFPVRSWLSPSVFVLSPSPLLLTEYSVGLSTSLSALIRPLSIM